MSHLRLASRTPSERTDAPRTSPRDTHVMRGTQVETRVHQRQCERCQRWFWPWDQSRARCFVCEPLPPDRLKRLLGSIRGETTEATGPEILAVPAR